MVKAMDKMRYPRKKGYAGRYVRHELGKNKLNLLLGCVFLLGALVGCQLAGQDPETILSQLGSLFSATGQSAGFLDTVVASFAANAALLLILCLCGLGAVFQPLALGVLFWRGLGLGVLGVYSYSAGERAAVLYYLLVLLPQALLEVLLLVSAAGESLRLSQVECVPNGLTGLAKMNQNANARLIKTQQPDNKTRSDFHANSRNRAAGAAPR